MNFRFFFKIVLKHFTCQNPKIHLSKIQKKRGNPVFLSTLPKGQGQLDPLPTKATGYQSCHAGFERLGRVLENTCSFATDLTIIHVQRAVGKASLFPVFPHSFTQILHYSL